MHRFMVKPDPLGVPRNPLAVYLLCLTLVSGLVAVFGPTPGTVEGELSGMFQIAWGVVLVYGASAALLGAYWQGDIRTGLLMKRQGASALTIGAGLYSIILLGALGLTAIFTSGIVLGFSAACFIYWRVINRRINDIVHKSPSEDSSPHG